MRVQPHLLRLSLILSVLFAGLLPWHGVAAHHRPGDRLAFFQQAAQRSGVPLALLIGLSWEQSRLADHAGQSVDGGYGLLDLSDRPGHRTLPAAAALLHAPPGRLRHNDGLNLLGGALLLARQARSLNHGQLPAALSGWAAAIVQFTGMHSAFAAQLLLRDLHAGLRQGIHAADIQLAPLTVHFPAVLALPRSLPLSSRSTETRGPADYAEASWQPANYNNYRDAHRPAGHPIRYIVIHDTEGSCASAVNTFQDSAAQASAHYLVCLDGTVIQLVHERDIAFHAGNWPINQESIGIEHEGYRDHADYTRAQYLASALLVRYLAHKYGIVPNRNVIFGHENVPAATHTDPGPSWNWSFYMDEVRGDTLGYDGGVTGVGMATAPTLIRTCPQESCAVVGSANWGEQFALAGERSGWFRLDYGGETGWVPGDALVAGSGYLVRLTAPAVVRAGPTIKDTVIGQTSAGQTYVSLQRDHGYWLIYYNHRYGFVSSTVSRAVDCRPAHAATAACMPGGGQSLVAVPNAVRPTGSLTIAGMGFSPGGLVTVSLGGQQVQAITSSPTGSLAASITMPAGMPAGPTELTATDSDGHTLQVSVLIEQPLTSTPRITLAPPVVLPAQHVTIRGEGFPGIQAVTLRARFILSDGKARTAHLVTPSGPHGTLESVQLTIPIDAVSGSVVITAKSGAAQGKAVLVVGTPNPSATPTPGTTPNAGATVTQTEIPPVTGTPSPTVR